MNLFTCRIFQRVLEIEKVRLHSLGSACPFMSRARSAHWWMLADWCKPRASLHGQVSLEGPTFEPLDHEDLEVLSLKMSLLFSQSSVRTAGDLCAPSVQSSGISVSDDRWSVGLRPNPSFQPKVVTSLIVQIICLRR